jgi:hypothetical protein
MLLRETALFKIDLDLSKDVQRRYEFIEWKEKVIKICIQMFSDNHINDIDLNNEESKTENGKV